MVVMTFHPWFSWAPAGDTEDQSSRLQAIHYASLPLVLQVYGFFCGILVLKIQSTFLDKESDCYFFSQDEFLHVIIMMRRKTLVIEHLD